MNGLIKELMPAQIQCRLSSESAQKWHQLTGILSIAEAIKKQYYKGQKE